MKITQPNVVAATVALGSTAAGSTYTPTAPLVSTTVQAAIDELEVQIVALQAGGLVLLEQHTANNTSPNLDFTTCFTSTYDDYVLDIVNLLNATDGMGFVLQYSSDGGSTWVATGYAWSYQYLLIGGTSIGVVNSASDTSIRLANANKNTSTSGLNGVVRLFDPLNTAKYKRVMYDLVQVNSGDTNTYTYRGGALLPSATAMNALRLAVVSSGNLTDGTARVYGVAK